MFKFKSVTNALVLSTAVLALAGCSSTPASSTTAPAAQAPAAPTEVKAYEGQGQTTVFRVGPGKDEKGNMIYSFTTVTASALFDKDGKILDVYFDSLEVLSPNDTEHVGVPKIAGWPGQASYAETEAITEDSAKKMFSEWKTKRERGDAAYGMNWSEQMNNFQEKLFKGKTVAEVEQWVAKYTSDTNKKPLTEKSTADADKAKFAALSDADKKALADVTSGSTISISDAHGDFIGALKKAYANKVEVTVPVK